tara:strand:- start:1736 stop:2260 length:525 start_codon:yes stop_codon:yes gene_type:complete
MHRLPRKLFPLFLLLASISSFAERPGFSATESGHLSLVIVASDTPGYIEEWLSTPSEHAVTVRRLRQAKPDQLVVSAFLASGLTANPQGEYAFRVSFYVLDPNGKAILGARDYAGGSGVLPDKPMLIMADPALDIIFEKSDSMGTYTIVAQLMDLIAGTKTDASYKIDLVQGAL